MAEKIGPERTDVRLPLEAMPSEVRPLVHTINEALERLERGFMVQRDFTADAAHELRTPLSILQARIDTIPDTPGREGAEPRHRAHEAHRQPAPRYRRA